MLEVAEPFHSWKSMRRGMFKYLPLASFGNYDIIFPSREYLLVESCNSGTKALFATHA